MSSKPRVVKDYAKLPKEITEQIKLEYPHGFDRKLIMFKNAKKKLVSALPYEAEDFYYLIRMTKEQARQIILKDDAYDTDGHLLEKAKAKLLKKYAKTEEK